MLHRPSLDLTRRQWVHVRGDMTIFGTWFGATRAESEPCLAIIPTHRVRNFKPAVVCLSAAYLWNEEPRRTAQIATAFCQGLGFEPTSANVRKLVELVHDHLPELVAMPVMPSNTQLVVADGVVRDSEGGERHVEIVENL